MKRILPFFMLTIIGSSVALSSKWFTRLGQLNLLQRSGLPVVSFEKIIETVPTAFMVL